MSEIDVQWCIKGLESTRDSSPYSSPIFPDSDSGPMTSVLDLYTVCIGLITPSKLYCISASVRPTTAAHLVSDKQNEQLDYNRKDYVETFLHCVNHLCIQFISLWLQWNLQRGNSAFVWVNIGCALSESKKITVFDLNLGMNACIICMRERVG